MINEYTSLALEDVTKARIIRIIPKAVVAQKILNPVLGKDVAVSIALTLVFTSSASSSVAVRYILIIVVTKSSLKRQGRVGSELSH